MKDKKTERPGAGQIGQESFHPLKDADRLPLSSHHLASTTSVDEAEHFLSSTLVPLRFMKVENPQEFRLDMTGLQLNRVFLVYNAFGTDMVVDPGIIEDKVIVSLGEDARRPSHFEIDDSFTSIGESSGIAMSPTRQVRNFRPGGSGVFGAIIPAPLLTDRLEEVTGKAVKAPIVLDSQINLRRGTGRIFRECFSGILQELGTQPPAEASALQRTLLEDFLISVVLNLPGSHHQALCGEPPKAAAPAVVRRAEDYMAAHFRESITLSDLTRVAGCSRSTLTQTFRKCRGYSAMQFLAERRLEHARQRLMEESGAAVTEIVLASGFSNQGRFAKAYRERFGELPSDTCARCHGPGRR